MAGLLAARVLSEHFARVTVVERDVLPEAAAHRRGVPQGRHVHAVLPRGAELLEELFEGLTADLHGAGAITGSGAHDVRLLLSGHRLAPIASSLRRLFVSRPLLEATIRARVRTLPGVTVLDGHAVQGLVTTPNGRRVTGVRLSRPPGSDCELTLAADMVMDATGRGSRLPAWLSDMGYPVPRRDEVRVGVRYASRAFRLRPGALGGDRLLIVGVSRGCARLGALTTIEGGVHLCSLAGVLGDAPPTDLEGFLGFARSLAFPDLHDVIVDAEPLDDGAVFGYPANVRVRYDLLKRFPAGLLAIGDTLCAFNPSYGQGMTVAATEAAALRRMLASGAVPAAGAYFRKMARVIALPWNLTVGADLANPAVEGRRTPLVRLVNAYIPRFHAAAARDPRLAEAFMRVQSLIDPPPSLLRPDRVARVLLATRRRGPVARATAASPV